MRKNNSGVTLMELLIAMVLFALIMASATSIFITLKGLYQRYTTSETSLATTSLVAFGEMARWITTANEVTICAGAPPAACVNQPAGSWPRIQLRVDRQRPLAPTPGNIADDTTYTYWLGAGNTLRVMATGVGAFPEQTVATGVQALSFSFVDYPDVDPASHLNRVKISLTTTQATGGAMERLETTVVARCRRAQT